MRYFRLNVTFHENNFDICVNSFLTAVALYIVRV